MNFVFYFCSCGNEKDDKSDSELSLLDILKNVSSDVAFRSERGQLPSFETDGSKQRVYEALKELVKKHHYAISRLELITSGLNIWLYSIPTPPKCISINPSTKFLYHRVLRIYLGTQSDWNDFKAQCDKDVHFHIEDTGFEELE